MIGNDGNELTGSQYRWYYRDVLCAQLRNTFSLSEDRLLFITYQPKDKTYTPSAVSDFTNELFGEYPYIEVIEQTYKHYKKKNSSAFDGTYHSHILIRRSDFKALEHKLGYKLNQVLDIVDKVVWDIDGLTDKYLIKQRGVSSLGDLPLLHLPVKKQLSTDTITVSVEITYTQTINHKQTAIVFHKVDITVLQTKCFKNINKTKRFNMFIDDT